MPVALAHALAWPRTWRGRADLTRFFLGLSREKIPANTITC